MLDLTTIYNNTENPGFVTSMFTVLFAFILSSILAFTYEKTSRGINRPDQYIQALVLIGIVAAMVMQAIGDSLARGLGMLGALAIIRFRTTLRNPRNMVFMFASIAAGISCGVFGFSMAVTGTLGFCLVAFVLRLTPFSTEHNMIGTLRYNLPVKHQQESQIQQILKRFCYHFVLTRYRMTENESAPQTMEYEYQVKLKKEQEAWNLVSDMEEIPEIKGVRFSVRNREENI